MRNLLLIILLSTLVNAEKYPRIGNYFLDANVQNSDIEALAKCDLIVFDHMVSRERPHVIDSVRALNPSVKIIAYIVSQEINLSHINWNGSLNQSMLKEIDDSWWLLNAEGKNVQFWPGTHMLNIGAGQPEESSLQWNRYLAGIITDSILSDNRWDGVYLDNCWNSVHWVDSLGVDINRDGIADSRWLADSLWESGMNLMLDLIRQNNPDKIIVGNGGYRYRQLNGSLFEDFPSWGGWWRLTDIYLTLDSTAYGTPYNLVNGTTANTGEINLQHMRLGLTSALLGNGYFSYDFGANDHSQNWWFDEYSADLGSPLGEAQFHDILLLAENRFESGLGGWKSGNWKMSSSLVEDELWQSSACSISVTGEEQWNEILRSPELTIAEGAHVKVGLRIRVDSVQEGANLFVMLRQGYSYEKDIAMGAVALFPGMDTVLTYYSDSSFTGSGYSLMIGLEQGGRFLLDDITVESDENLYLTRTFDRGMVVVNPSATERTLSFPGYRRLTGSEDSHVNSGLSASLLKIEGQDGVILLRESTPVKGSNPPAEKSVSVRHGKTGIHIFSAPKGVVELVSLRGQVLYSKEINGSATIPTQCVAAGPYLLQIFDEKRKRLFTEKIRLQ